jgi:6-phosphogluconolactonase
MLKDNLFFFENIDKLSKQLASDIIQIADSSIKLNNSFKIVLTGGSSIINTYKILRDSKSDWEKWHIYLSDERCFPKGHKYRNDRMIKELWLDNGKIPKDNINFINAELGLFEAMDEYSRIVRKIDKFDVVLLSMGEDGHIASLFPNHSYSEECHVIVEKNSPKIPKTRISLSYMRLNLSKVVFKIIIGKPKQKVFNAFKKNQLLPINRVSGDLNKLFVC